MRVLILSAHPTARGVLRSLVTLGVEPIVVRGDHPEETEGSIQYVRVASRGDHDSPLDLRWSRRGLRTVLRDVRPDVLHIVGDPWTPTAEVGAAAARDLKIPYVLVGTSSIGEPRSITGRWQSDRIRRDAAGLAGTVRPALEHLRGPLGDRQPGAVLPPGGLAIPVMHRPRPAPESVVFALVGRLVPERGAELLLDALAATYGAWRLLIVGTGPSHEAIEQHAQRLGLSGRIQWLGALPRDQLAALWPEIDVLVLPSRCTPSWTEASGALVLEAMSHEVLPVVTRCGALPDVVGDSGLIIDQDDLVALTRALQGLVAEPGRCRVLGAAARQRVLEHYTDAATAMKMAQLWARVGTPDPSAATQASPIS